MKTCELCTLTNDDGGGDLPFRTDTIETDSLFTSLSTLNSLWQWSSSFDTNVSHYYHSASMLFQMMMMMLMLIIILIGAKRAMTGARFVINCQHMTTVIINNNKLLSFTLVHDYINQVMAMSVAAFKSTSIWRQCAATLSGFKCAITKLETISTSTKRLCSSPSVDTLMPLSVATRTGTDTYLVSTSSWLKSSSSLGFLSGVSDHLDSINTTGLVTNIITNSSTSSSSSSSSLSLSLSPSPSPKSSSSSSLNHYPKCTCSPSYIIKNVFYGRTQQHWRKPRTPSKSSNQHNWKLFFYLVLTLHQTNGNLVILFPLLINNEFPCCCPPLAPLVSMVESKTFENKANFGSQALPLSSLATQPEHKSKCNHSSLLWRCIVPFHTCTTMNNTNNSNFTIHLGK